jgi:hypothetical protein
LPQTAAIGQIPIAVFPRELAHLTVHELGRNNPELASRRFDDANFQAVARVMLVLGVTREHPRGNRLALRRFLNVKLAR